MSDETIHFQGDTIRGDIIQRQMAELTALRARLAEAIAGNERLRDRFSHYHVAKYVEGKLVDECASCGFDLRDSIHKRGVR